MVGVEGVTHTEDHFIGTQVLRGAALEDRDIAHVREDLFVGPLQIKGLHEDIPHAQFNTR